MGTYQMRLFNLIATVVTADLCVDYEIGTACVEVCDEIKSDCHNNCGDDTLCDYNCAVALDQCIQKCPCFSECEAGCDGCANDICTCAYPDENENHVDCVGKVEDTYVKCLSSCVPGDVHCLSM